MNTQKKQAGIIIIHSGGTQSNTAHRLSTAAKTKADNAWTGAGSFVFEFADSIFGGSTSTSISLTAISLIFGGVSTAGQYRRGIAPVASDALPRQENRFFGSENLFTMGVEQVFEL